jgi:hypothetical protein
LYSEFHNSSRSKRKSRYLIKVRRKERFEWRRLRIRKYRTFKKRQDGNNFRQLSAVDKGELRDYLVSDEHGTGILDEVR